MINIIDKRFHYEMKQVLSNGVVIKTPPPPPSYDFPCPGVDEVKQLRSCKQVFKKQRKCRLEPNSNLYSLLSFKIYFVKKEGNSHQYSMLIPVVMKINGTWTLQKQWTRIYVRHRILELIR